MNTHVIRTIGLGLIAVCMHSAFAADTVPAASDKLARARSHIDAQQWRAAIEELQRVDDKGSADWNNLMGYSLRKAKTPDYDRAEKHYDEALRIEPQHRGALEYSGELYLMKGNLPKAEERLASLDRICRLPCAEFTALKKAIADYKAHGHKVTATH